MAGNKTGLIHVYYGGGKGKTTAALGLIVRASGCGIPCVLVQFLKDAKCGELESLSHLPNVTVLRGKASGAMFTKDMTAEQLADTKKIHDENFARGVELCCDGGLLVLDELLDALALGVISQEPLRELIELKPPGLELVITGHTEINWVFEYADYITEMVKHRHPYDKGVSGRRGIEF